MGITKDIPKNDTDDCVDLFDLHGISSEKREKIRQLAREEDERYERWHKRITFFVDYILPCVISFIVSLIFNYYCN